MIPILILIGLEKVGKSTIFKKLNIDYNNNYFFNNFLNYKNINFNLCYSGFINFLLIDTRSIYKKYINYLSIENELYLLINNADIILFVIDINFLCFYENLLIYNFLKKNKKYVFLLINKFDNNKLYFDINFFNKIKFKRFYFISSIYNYNINYFINNILYIYCFGKKCFKKKIFFKNIFVSLIGGSRSGKSLLIKSLTKKKNLFDNFYLKYKKIYILINKLCIFLKRYLLKIIIISNIILFLLNPLNFINNLELKTLNFINKNYLSIIFIINKSDLLNLSEFIVFKNYIKNKLNIKNFYILFLSSLFIYNIKYIKYILNKVYNFSILNISTSKLNKIFFNYSKFIKIYYNNDIKVNYIHQGGKNPILIIIHGKNIKIKKCYKKFLKKIFYKKLNIKSVFLKIRI